MLAHDIKTPIKAQVTALKLLHSGVFGKLSDEAENIILNILASNKYLQLLLDNILGEYRSNQGKITLHKKENDIRNTVEESIKNTNILFESKNQKIEVNYLTKNFIKFYDEIEIQRVIINLLSNAFEYSKENSTVNIIVKANGEHLKIEIKSKMKISSNENNLACKSSGNGLGLKICEKIIEMHSGIFYKEKNKDKEFISAFELP